MIRKLLPFLLFIVVHPNIYGQDKPDNENGSGSKSDYTLTEGHRGLHGYIGYGAGKAPEGFGAGISYYSAVWPLVNKPLANFQIGLPGTWITPENSDVDFPLCPRGTLARNWVERGPTWGSVFQTIEGGHGFRRGIRFNYGLPKSSPNGIPGCYEYGIATPGWSFYQSSQPLDDDKLGLAQLSNRILIPPDGLTFGGTPNGKFLGYAWMALPFMDNSDGPPPTGDQSWTLFMNAANFKGPVAYFIAETWSKISKDYPLDLARGLDARPGVIYGGAMEINTVPKIEATSPNNDSVFYKIPQLHFPVDEYNRTQLVQQVRCYSKEALYYPFKTWQEGGQECTGIFNSEGIWAPALNTWMPTFDQGGTKLKNMDDIFTTHILFGNIFGILWDNSSSFPAGEFPQYFLQVGGGDRVPVPDSVVPPELISKEFRLKERGSPYTSPGTGAWSDPGPASDPIEVVLTDGSTVTYRWYRFIDQPSLQQFDWSKEKREKLQSLVEKIHANWLISKDYMEPPRIGELATFDSALIVNPPPGYEVGYVPIVTGQE